MYINEKCIVGSHVCLSFLFHACSFDSSNRPEQNLGGWFLSTLRSALFISSENCLLILVFAVYIVRAKCSPQKRYDVYQPLWFTLPFIYIKVRSYHPSFTSIYGNSVDLKALLSYRWNVLAIFPNKYRCPLIWWKWLSGLRISDKHTYSNLRDLHSVF